MNTKRKTEMPTKEELEKAIAEKESEIKLAREVAREAQGRISTLCAERSAFERQLNEILCPFAIGDKVKHNFMDRGKVMVVVGICARGAVVSNLKKDGTPGLRKEEFRFTSLFKVS